MPSITSWMRLEPRCRDAEMKTSLQARIYNPLWLLARQWQFGEFQGEDNGSPILASWRAEAAPLTRFHAGVIAPNTRVNAPPYNGSRLPLETLVEREPVGPARIGRRLRKNSGGPWNPASNFCTCCTGSHCRKITVPCLQTGFRFHL